MQYYVYQGMLPITTKNCKNSNIYGGLKKFYILRFLPGVALGLATGELPLSVKVFFTLFVRRNGTAVGG